MAAFFGPRISSARTVREHKLGQSRGVLLTDVQATGVQYTHILMVYGADGAPLLAVTSEVNAMAAAGSGGSHFLCLFSGGRHLNMGASDEWADLEKFEVRALAIANRSLDARSAN
jgi:hypothetical protein